MLNAAVTKFERITPSVVLLRIVPDSPLVFKAGQFVQVLINHNDKILRKAYSIYSNPSTPDYFELCVKVIAKGIGSNYLANLKIGDRLEIAGPFGRFCLQDEISNDLIFVATGTGISALKAMIEIALAKEKKHHVWLFFGVRTVKDLINHSEYESFRSKYPNFHYCPVLSRSDDKEFEHGHVQDAFKKMVEPSNQDVYICGLIPMVNDVKQLCDNLKFPKEKVHFEVYV